MHIKFKILPFLLGLGGCFNTIHNDIPSKQIAMKSEKREQIASQLLKEGRAFIRNNNVLAGLNKYKEICKHYLETEAAPMAFHAWGTLLRDKGNFSGAFEKLRFITKNYTSYEQYNQVVVEEFHIACKLMKDYETSARKKLGLWFKDATPGIECFQHIVTMAPRSAYAPKALLHMAQLEYLSGEKAKAIEALDRLISDYPDSDLVPQAYLLEGEIYLSFVNGPQYDQGMTKKAINCYEDYLRLFGSRSDLLAETGKAKKGLHQAMELYAGSRLVLGDFFLNRRSYPQGAIVFYNEARLLAPNSDKAREANARIDFANTNELPPMTWADRILGRIIYKPTNPNP